MTDDKEIQAALAQIPSEITAGEKTFALQQMTLAEENRGVAMQEMFIRTPVGHRDTYLAGEPVHLGRPTAQRLNDLLRDYYHNVAKQRLGVTEPAQGRVIDDSNFLDEARRLYSNTGLGPTVASEAARKEHAAAQAAVISTIGKGVA